MPSYTFDLKLRATVTVESPTGKEALELVRAAFNWAGGNPADCNGGAWPNGDPILFEASLIQRPDIGLIDGEESPVVTMNEWRELNRKESGNA